MARILDHVYGHNEVVEVLLSAVEKGRLASSLIFAGPGGVGKRKTALGIAQALVCEKSRKACGYCGACLRIEVGQSESLFMVEPSGQNIKIEQSREVVQFLNLRQVGNARVIIIDEAQTMNPQSANALLKVVEEPPPGTHFIFVTPNAPALLSTIRSRSQMIRFQPLTIEALRKIVKEQNLPVEEWALRSALGRADQALQLSDQQAEWAEARITALSCLAKGLAGQDALEQLKELAKDKGSALFVLRVWLGLLRDLALAHGGAVERAMNSDQKELLQWGLKIPPDWIHFLSRKILQLEQDILGNIDRNLAFENFWYLLKKSSAGGPVNAMD